MFLSAHDHPVRHLMCCKHVWWQILHLCLPACLRVSWHVASTLSLFTASHVSQLSVLLVVADVGVDPRVIRRFAEPDERLNVGVFWNEVDQRQLVPCLAYFTFCLSDRACFSQSQDTKWEIVFLLKTLQQTEWEWSKQTTRSLAFQRWR